MKETTATCEQQVKHTPGPWAARGFEVYEDRIDGRRVLMVCRSNEAYDWPEEQDAEIEANLRLAAAGPDLLEAARWAETELAELIGFSVSRTDHPAVVALRKLAAAIAKATGGAA